MSEATTVSATNGDVARPVVVIELPPKTFPYLSLALLVGLVLIFVAELTFPIRAATEPLTPDIATLIGLGAVQRLLIGQGEWWRMFTGPLLHSSPFHLGMNGLVLMIAGAALERAVGRWWFGALFVIGGLGGVCGTLLFDPRNIVSVGASGAIMGLFASILVISFRYTSPQTRGMLQRIAFQVLIPSLLPLTAAAQAGKVDFAAHAGGAIAGGAAAYFVSELWRDADSLPGFRWPAMAVVCLGVLGAITGGVEVVLGVSPRQSPPMWSTAPQQAIEPAAPQQLIPPDYLPKTALDIHEQLAFWYVSKYPADPRAHFYKALFLLRKPDLTAAEQELRIAMERQSALGGDLRTNFVLDVSWTMALVLFEQQRLDEARAIAAQACLDPSSARTADLHEKGLCTDPK